MSTSARRGRGREKKPTAAQRRMLESANNPGLQAYADEYLRGGNPGNVDEYLRNYESKESKKRAASEEAPEARLPKKQVASSSEPIEASAAAKEEEVKKNGELRGDHKSGDLE